MSEPKEETLIERLKRVSEEKKETSKAAPAGLIVGKESAQIENDAEPLTPQAQPNQVTAAAESVIPGAEEKKYHVYHCTILSCRMITPTGAPIAFVDGMYVTDSEEMIAYLESELANNHPRLYVKKGQELMTSTELDPMEALRKKHIADYLKGIEEQAAKVKAGTLPESESDQQKLVPGSTSDVADLATGSGV